MTKHDYDKVERLNRATNRLLLVIISFFIAMIVAGLITKCSAQTRIECGQRAFIDFTTKGDSIEYYEVYEYVDTSTNLVRVRTYLFCTKTENLTASVIHSVYEYVPEKFSELNTKSRKYQKYFEAKDELWETMRLFDYTRRYVLCKINRL